MKDFLKHTLATIAGLFIFSIIVIIIGVMSLVGMVSAGEATKTVADKSVLVLNLSGELQKITFSNSLPALPSVTWDWKRSYLPLKRQKAMIR